MKRLHIYADSSVIGRCEDPEFSEDSLASWRLFIKGDFVLVLSAHTLRELQDAPDEVRSHILEVPGKMGHPIIPLSREKLGHLGRTWVGIEYCKRTPWKKALLRA